ncbi:MAG: hypothetical protein E7773_09950 [Sphingomonas sp.]|uniref:hypothetical protein n=1 Tax=Sphingomonas sp. TaxID=28214 RepID=UPI00122C0AF4|nr:hypothetical protein [Sphingomonas sp.]THD36228.1 MAG: hypothetical protein E7773_09950 [Sphingomonas sp.]
MEIVEIGRIFLDLDNPRHEPYETEAQVIDYLCRYENVLPLAKDIATNGLNPLELLAVIPDGIAGKGEKQSYIVAEGNRRLCALKLLTDPERAPTTMRKTFEALSEHWSAIDDLVCRVFPDRDAVRMWLSRIHEGEQGGIGRKKWNADQTARFSGDTKNKVALSILDYAEAEGIITANERKGKLTTVQRYVANPLVREALGIDNSDIDNVCRIRSKDDFDLLLRKFLGDLGRGYVNSRTTKDQHVAYARELANVQGQSSQTVPPESIKVPVAGKTAPKRRKPAKRKQPNVLTYEQDIMNALTALGGEKLPSLYNSICTVPLSDHTPLVTIGSWALLESLSGRAGRKTDQGFPAYFSKLKLQQYGLAVGKGDKAIHDALTRLSTSGDVTKHDGKAAFFNGPQLINDMETLKDLILKCAEEAQSSKP